MSYIINKRDGTQLTTIIDGTTNTTATSLTLVGQNYVGWGEIFQENLVHLMENFARSALPANALVGQLWFDTTAKSLKVLVAEDIWRPLATSASGTLPPTTPNVGDFWYDTTTRQVKVWDSTKWQVVGPVFTNTQGPTGANAITIADSVNTPRHVVALEARGATFAIFNSYPEFPTQTEVPGFGNTIPRGFSFRSNINSDVLFHGTVQNAMTIQSIPLESLLRGDIDDHTSGNLYIKNNAGLWLGENSELKISYDAIETDVDFGNVIFTLANERNIRVTGAFDTGERIILQSDIRTGLLSVYDDPVIPMGVSTKNYTDTTVSNSIDIVNGYIRSNVAAINNSLGILTTEINRVNNYAQNLGAIKANLASPTLTGTPVAPNVAVTNKSDTIATTAFVHSVMPTGVILMWSGAVNTIPTGWALCNGFNGTPDLRDRFIVGAGSTYTPGQTGGNVTQTVTTTTAGEHSHTGSSGSTTLTANQFPAHTHDFYDIYAMWGDQRGNYSIRNGVPYTDGYGIYVNSGYRDPNGNFASNYFYYSNAQDGDNDGGAYAVLNRTLAQTGGSGQGHSHGIGSDGVHVHTSTIPASQPLFYSLCYIMKTA